MLPSQEFSCELFFFLSPAVPASISVLRFLCIFFTVDVQFYLVASYLPRREQMLYGKYPLRKPEDDVCKQKHEELHSYELLHLGNFNVIFIVLQMWCG